jgi:hypothetical protein
MKRTISILCLAVTMVACQQQQTRTASASAPAPSASSATHPLSPEQLGALGAEIRKEPARADELLQQHGLTRAEFEKQIRDVTENADASRRYADAYRKGSA